VPPSPVFERLYGDGRTHVLAVSRLAPNKRLEDVLRAFALLQRGPVPRSRLLLVGDDGLHAYADALRRLAGGLRLRDVVFCGHVEEDELRSAYRLADVLVSLSEHEGYGVPLVEAMLAGVPVVAYDAGAVAETMDGAGVLLGEKRPELVAGVIERLVGDTAFRAAGLAGQEKVAARVRATDFGARVLGALAPVLGEGS
jgi:glycosyltransferase involved in cell wall biosynthesis